MTGNIDSFEKKTDPSYQLRLPCTYIVRCFFACLFVFFSWFASIKTQIFFLKISLVKLLLFLPSRYKARVVYTRLLLFVRFTVPFACFPCKHMLSFMCLWLCSCCSLRQECHFLHLVLGKLAFLYKTNFSFPQESLIPLCSLLILHKTAAAHIVVVTRPHLAAFVLTVPKCLVPETFFPR